MSHSYEKIELCNKAIDDAIQNEIEITRTIIPKGILFINNKFRNISLYKF